MPQINNGSDAGKLKKEIGERLYEFRTKGMKELKENFEQFLKSTGVSIERFKTYEKGEEFPDIHDLQKICAECCLNLNWLIYGNGSMFSAREKDMEELIQHIEKNETRRYEDYKKLLKSMQVPEMEDFIFNVHEAVIDLVSRINNQLENDPDQVYETTLRMIPEVSY